MTMEANVVTPLRPAPKDPRAAARQAKKRSQIKINRDAAPNLGRLPQRTMTVPWSVWPLAGTTVGLMAVSMTHLSDGVTQLTSIPEWQAWAMAIGIDAMLISVALAQLTASPEVKKDIALVARIMEAGTLVMSAGLNALAFTGGAFDVAHWAQIGFGAFVPMAISGSTFILARMTRGAA